MLRIIDLAYANHVICSKSDNNTLHDWSGKACGVALCVGQILCWWAINQWTVISKCIESENYRSHLHKSAGDFWCLCTSKYLNVVTCSTRDVLYHQAFTMQLWGCNYFCTWHALCTLYYVVCYIIFYDTLLEQPLCVASHISSTNTGFSAGDVVLFNDTLPTTTHCLHKHTFLHQGSNFYL